MEENFWGNTSMSLRDEIAKQALSLPPEDRVYLADQLEQSLPHDEFATAEIAMAWASEVDRRLDAFDSGQTQAAGFDEVMHRLRQRLAEYRAGKAAT
jgi:putative addiction module component (TIGR02574 family)